jgi:Fur family peroxide stress response transcriptional regulator
MPNSGSPISSVRLTTSAETASHVRTALLRAGCRYTQQRAAVYGYLEQVENHPTAEEVYKAVRRWLPRISLATVYNALEALVQARLANKLTYGDGSARYDCRDEQHYHLRDEQTGEVRDLPTQFDADLLRKLDPELLERLSSIGFQVSGYRLEVLGRFEKK